jgi:hypothetical protein
MKFRHSRVGNQKTRILFAQPPPPFAEKKLKSLGPATGRHQGFYPITPFRLSNMRTQLRHINLSSHGSSDLLVTMTMVGLLLLAFLAYTLYRQKNGHWIVIWRLAKKEKADDDLLRQGALADPLAKKGVDLEGGKRRQYVVEDLYRFRTVTSLHEVPHCSREAMGNEEVLVLRSMGHC